VNTRLFVVSAVLHSGVILGVSWLQLYALAEAGQWLSAVIILALVAVMGGLKGTQFGRRAQGSFIAGVVFAASAATVIGLWFMWALAFPVGEPPPLRQYLAKHFVTMGNFAWLVVPTLAVVIASVVGVEIGVRIRRILGGSIPSSCRSGQGGRTGERP
jgi:hypothetical protein